MRVHDSLIAFAFLILGIVVVVAAQDLSPAPGQPIGPALFPTIAGIILAGSSIGLILRSLLAPGPKLWIEIPENLREPRNFLSLLLTAAAVVFYIWASDALGFILCAFIILAVLLISYGTRPLLAIAVAAILPFVVYYLFASVLSVPLPSAFIEAMI